MIRRDVTTDGLVVVRSWARVELHDKAGNILEGREPTAEERAEFEAWEAAQPHGAEWRAAREALAAALAARRAERQALRARIEAAPTVLEKFQILVAALTEGDPDA